LENIINFKPNEQKELFVKAKLNDSSQKQAENTIPYDLEHVKAFRFLKKTGVLDMMVISFPVDDFKIHVYPNRTQASVRHDKHEYWTYAHDAIFGVREVGGHVKLVLHEESD